MYNRIEILRNMSQRTAFVNEEFIVDLKLKVSIKSFSNHNDFSATQIENAISEFKSEIKNEIGYIIDGEHLQQDFIQTVDYVTYEIEILK